MITFGPEKISMNMGKYKKIDNANLGQLDNSEYTRFMQRFHELAFPAQESGEEPDDGGSPGTVSLLQTRAAEGNPELGISAEEQEAFEKDLALMSDLVEISRIKKETKELKPVDERRDDVVTYFIASVRQQQSSPIAAQSDAAKDLYEVVKPYEGVYREANEAETIKIDGLLADVAKEGLPELVATLGLTAVVAELQSLNDQYKTLSAERLKTETAILEKESSAEIRKRMDDLYDDMTTIAFVQSVANPTEGTAAFVSQLNTLIKKTKATYKARRSLESKGDKKEEGDSSTTTPTTPPTETETTPSGSENGK